MIICPNCKEEIDDDSHYCDQCGQMLFYCEKCGRVGLGRRCTSCGGLMLSADDFQNRPSMRSISSSFGMSQGFISQRASSSNPGPNMGVSQRGVMSGMGGGMPQLLLYNDSLGIRVVGMNGAIIGRRQGPYVQFFQQQMYMSGAHAQLLYSPDTGWRIVDKHSSNGTKLNDHKLQPDVEMSLKNGDIVILANVVLKVSIN